MMRWWGETMSGESGDPYHKLKQMILNEDHTLCIIFIPLEVERRGKEIKPLFIVIFISSDPHHVTQSIRWSVISFAFSLEAGLDKNVESEHEMRRQEEEGERIMLSIMRNDCQGYSYEIWKWLTEWWVVTKGRKSLFASLISLMSFELLAPL